MQTKRAVRAAFNFAVFSIGFTAIMFIMYFVFTHYGFSSRAAAEIGTPDEVVVIIDAGHGGEDGGAVGVNGKAEKEINLAVAEKLFELLNCNSIKTIMTRSDDDALYDKNDMSLKGKHKITDMKARLEIASQSPTALFVSVHMNTYPSGNCRGLMTYYSKNNAEGKGIAESIQSEVKKHLQPQNNRASKPATSAIYLLDRIQNPAVLIECGFLTNAEECQMLCDEEYQSRLAFVIFNAICGAVAENRASFE